MGAEEYLGDALERVGRAREQRVRARHAILEQRTNQRASLKTWRSIEYNDAELCASLVCVAKDGEHAVRVSECEQNVALSDLQKP